MDASLWVAKTGLNAQQTRMSVIANNLANVNTTGFKRDRAKSRYRRFEKIKALDLENILNFQKRFENNFV